jgi:hypothetical protein
MLRAILPHFGNNRLVNKLSNKSSGSYKNIIPKSIKNQCIIIFCDSCCRDSDLFILGLVALGKKILILNVKNKITIKNETTSSSN